MHAFCRRCSPNKQHRLRSVTVSAAATPGSSDRPVKPAYNKYRCVACSADGRVQVLCLWMGFCQLDEVSCCIAGAGQTSSAATCGSGRRSPLAASRARHLATCPHPLPNSDTGPGMPPLLPETCGGCLGVSTTAVTPPACCADAHDAVLGAGLPAAVGQVHAGARLRALPVVACLGAHLRRGAHPPPRRRPARCSPSQWTSPKRTMHLAVELVWRRACASAHVVHEPLSGKELVQRRASATA
jgi:hypothetical protein